MAVANIASDWQTIRFLGMGATYGFAFSTVGFVGLCLGMLTAALRFQEMGRCGLAIMMVIVLLSAWFGSKI